MPTFIEPTWGTEGQKLDCECSSLDSTGLRPSVITGVLLRWLQWHFCRADNIRDSSLKSYLWTDDETTKMWILPNFKYDPKLAESRPMILVQDGDMTTKEFGIDHARSAHLDEAGNFKGDSYQVILTGKHAVHCVSREPMEASRIAEEAFFRMLEYHELILREFRFGEFRVAGLSGLAKKDGAADEYFRTIQVLWSFGHMWTMVSEAPVFKKAGIVTNIR